MITARVKSNSIITVIILVSQKKNRSPPRINVPRKLSDELKCSRASFSGRHSFIKDLNKNPNLNKLNLRPPHNYLPPEARDPLSFSLGLFFPVWRWQTTSGVHQQRAEKERRGDVVRRRASFVVGVEGSLKNLRGLKH